MLSIRSESAAIEKIIGFVGYWVKPNLKNRWGGAFNGQRYRTEIFHSIIRNLNVDTIIETGSYRGDTTSLFSTAVKSVYSVEFNPRNYGYSVARFIFNSRVNLTQGDSREYLQFLKLDLDPQAGPLLFYLDAHWNNDLPLAEEIEIIFSRWPNSLILVDDFKVPDTNYGYDNYGPEKQLTLSYLRKLPNFKNFNLFFPKLDESHETGSKRGCVVISNDADSTAKLIQISQLQRFNP